MELMLETKITTDTEDVLDVTIESWLDDYRIQLQGDFGRVLFPLRTFDEVAAIVAKFRAANLILTGGGGAE